MSEQNIPTPIDTTLTQAGYAADAKVAGEAIMELQNLVGEESVVKQISVALDAHEHRNYVSKEDFEALQQTVIQLCNLVGDDSVTKQISIALDSVTDTLLTKINL